DLLRVSYHTVRLPDAVPGAPPPPPAPRVTLGAVWVVSNCARLPSSQPNLAVPVRSVGWNTWNSRPTPNTRTTRQPSSPPVVASSLRTSLSGVKRGLPVTVSPSEEPEATVRSGTCLAARALGPALYST